MEFISGTMYYLSSICKGFQVVSLFEMCESLKLVFVTGKGGIGKSLISASLALKYHQSGKRVLLVQQAATDHLGPLIGCSGVGHEESYPKSGLAIANYTAAGNFKDFVVKHLKHGALFESLISNKVVHGFFTAIPGFGELMLLGRLFYAVNLAPERPDIVIVDSYASGHFMSLMTTPDAILQSGLAGPIATETAKVKGFLSDKKQCGSIVVGVPEELVVSEMLDLIPQLQAKAPVAVKGVVFNRDLLLALGDVTSETHSSDVLNRFLLERLERQKIANELWQKLTRSTPLESLQVARVPELGFVDDPLSALTVELVVGPSMGERGSL